MASKVRLSRHVYLRTQQRRLRHVRSILVRNLNVPTSEHLDDPLSLCVFFTLHSPKCPDEVIYTSQRVSGSYNPSWESLLFGSTNGRILTFIVRLWVSMEPDAEKFEVVYEKIINLLDLLYIGTQLNKDISVNPAVGNSFIIGMHEGFYSDGAVTGAPPPPPVSHPLTQFLPAQSLMEVPKPEMQSAYENNIALRLLKCQKFLNIAKLKSDRARTEVNTFLLQHSALFGAKVEKEGLKSRIAMLKQQLVQQKNLEEDEQRALACLRGSQDVVEARLRYQQEELRRNKTHFREQQLKNDKEILKLQRVKLHKRMRQNNMIIELCDAFCIKKEGENFTICDVILPNVDQLESLVSTEQLGVALGYTAHLVEQLGKVLLVPLPYPLKPNGSRSTVFDHISDASYTDNIKEFPLYVKNSSDKWLYRYAMFLLTRDIIQLRLQCGIRTTRQMYKKTLCCLKDLLDRLLPPYQPDMSNTKQRHDIGQQRVALSSVDSTLQLCDITGPYTGEHDQSYTPDPPSQASDQPSQLSDPCSDSGFNIEEFQNGSAITESLQASVAMDDYAGLDVGGALGEMGVVDNGEERTAGVAGFQVGDRGMVTPPPPYSSVVPHNPSNGAHASTLVEEVEPKSQIDDLVVVQQSTPVSTRTLEATSRQNDALNRVFDEIFAKRKLNILTQSKESEGGMVPVTTTTSSTYVNLLTLQGEGTMRPEDPRVMQQDSGRVTAEPAELCRLEDFIDSPPARVQGGTATYETLCELGECSDQTVCDLDPGVGSARS